MAANFVPRDDEGMETENNEADQTVTDNTLLNITMIDTSTPINTGTNKPTLDRKGVEPDEAGIDEDEDDGGGRQNGNQGEQTPTIKSEDEEETFSDAEAGEAEADDSITFIKGRIRSKTPRVKRVVQQPGYYADLISNKHNLSPPTSPKAKRKPGKTEKASREETKQMRNLELAVATRIAEERLKKIAELAKENDKLEQKIMEEKDKLTHMENTIKELEETVRILMERMSDTEYATNNMREKMEETTTENNENNDRIKELEERLQIQHRAHQEEIENQHQKHQEEKEEITARLENKNTEVETLENSMQGMNITKERHSLTIIDSNRRMITPYVKSDHTKWTHSNNQWTLEEIEEALQEEVNRQELRKYDIVVISTTTNHLRQGESADNIAAKIRKTIITLKKINNKMRILLITPPPIITSVRQSHQQARLCETLIQMDVEGVEVINTQEEMMNCQEDILQMDGFHLTRAGGRITAIKINEAIKNIARKTKIERRTREESVNQGEENKREEELRQKTTIVKLDKSIAKHVIGKEGRVIRRLMDRHRVHIEIRAEDEDQTKARAEIASGNERDRKAAADEIREIIKDQADREDNRQRGRPAHSETRTNYTTRSPSTSENRNGRMSRAEQPYKRDTECVFFLAGQCRYGQSCQFKHNEESDSRNGSRPERSRSGRRDDYRNERRVHGERSYRN
jgi:hypothetical protein